MKIFLQEKDGSFNLYEVKPKENEFRMGYVKNEKSDKVEVKKIEPPK